MNAHLKSDKPKCHQLVKELNITDEDEKSPAAVRLEIIEILSTIYLPTKDFHVDEVPLSLTHELTQFTHGKTEQTLNDICNRYLLNITENKHHIIQIIITNNSLLETKQWKVRTKHRAEKENYDTITIDILSSDQSSEYHNIDKYISEMMQIDKKDKYKLPNVLIVCFHKKRIEDIEKLLKTFSCESFMIDQIKVKFHLSFDEPDANLGLCSKFLSSYKKYKNILSGIEFITATPYHEFWKMLKTHNIFNLINPHSERLDKTSYKTYLENYQQIKDHTHIICNFQTQNPLEYIEHVFSNGYIDRKGPRKIIFSPAHLFTETEGVGSHEEVVDFYNELGFTVFLSNGKFKGFIEPNGEKMDLLTFNDIHNIKGELRDTLREWARLNPNKNLAITGNTTIERGITIQTNGFHFTHSIISHYHKKSINKLVQLVGRLTGDKKYVGVSILICPEEIIDTVCSLVDKTIELRKENPENYNSTDFSNKNSTIPVKLTFMDESFRLKCVDCINSKGKYKKSLHALLKEGYQTGQIMLEDRNNVNVFTNDTKDKTGATKLFDDIHKKISIVRMYKISDTSPESRRFAQFHKAFHSYKATSQTCKPGEYNIDLAEDTYHHNGFTHETNIAYITFRVD
jgi:hypothetical protein